MIFQIPQGLCLFCVTGLRSEKQMNSVSITEALLMILACFDTLTLLLKYNTMKVFPVSSITAIFLIGTLNNNPCRVHVPS